MTIQELFIINLKEYRKLRKISQSKLAAQCNSSQTYIAAIEVGKNFPSPEMIERIAAALEIESYFLFKNEPVGNGMTKKQLTPTQRREITDKIDRAVLKIIGQY